MSKCGSKPALRPALKPVPKYMIIFLEIAFNPMADLPMGII